MNFKFTPTRIYKQTEMWCGVDEEKRHFLDKRRELGETEQRKMRENGFRRVEEEKFICIEIKGNFCDKKKLFT